MQKNLYSHLMNGCYELKEEHAHDVKELMIEAFITNNKIWSSANLNRKQLGGFFDNVIREHLESQENVRREVLPNAVLNFIYVLNGKLVACLLHYEIDQYRKYMRNSKESTIPLFRELQREGRELIKCVDIESLAKGRYIYCTWAAHIQDPQYNQMKKVQQVADIYDKIRSQGLEGMICRSSNIKIIKILFHLGGELLKESIFTREQKDFSLYFAMLHLQNDSLGEFIENTKRMRQESMSAKL